MPTRASQARQFWLAMDLHELKLRAYVGRARNSFIISAAVKYQTTHSTPAWLREAHKQRLAEILTAHYQTVIQHFGALALRQIKSRRVETKSDTFTAAMRAWVTREALRKATMISSTDSDDIRDAIQDGIDDGLGIAEIASSIRAVSNLTAFRSAVVARTETHAAATFGSIESVRDAEQILGVTMLKAWLPTVDERTRPAHAAMAEADPIPLNEKFTVGAELMDRPGDPSASPENTVNCRCALIYEEA